MGDDFVLQLILFYVATAIAIVSSHINLVRLIANTSAAPLDAVQRERPGVLIVVEFSLVIIVCAPIPIVIKLLSSAEKDQFSYAVWIVPTITALLGFLDLWQSLRLRKSGKRIIDFYYLSAMITGTGLSVFLLVTYYLGFLKSSQQFFLSLSIPLLIIVAQFLRSTLRFSRYPNL